MSHLVQNETDPDRLPVAYSSWYGIPVVLRVDTARTRKLQTELHCTIEGESDAAVHIRMGHRNQNIWKKMILAVEEIAEPLHGDGDRDCSYRRARH
jgi:hypothetical protein